MFKGSSTESPDDHECPRILLNRRGPTIVNARLDKTKAAEALAEALTCLIPTSFMAVRHPGSEHRLPQQGFFSLTNRALHVNSIHVLIIHRQSSCSVLDVSMKDHTGYRSVDVLWC